MLSHAKVSFLELFKKNDNEKNAKEKINSNVAENVLEDKKMLWKMNFMNVKEDEEEERT